MAPRMMFDENADTQMPALTQGGGAAEHGHPAHAEAGDFLAGFKGEQMRKAAENLPQRGHDHNNAEGDAQPQTDLHENIGQPVDLKGDQRHDIFH